MSFVRLSTAQRVSLVIASVLPVAVFGCGMLPRGLVAGEAAEIGTDTGVARGGMLLAQVFNSAPFTATFTPTAANQTIGVSVFGSTGGSRITFTVTDSSGAEVASFTTPTTDVSTTTFTGSDTGTYTLSVTETGTTAPTYSVRVMQSPTGNFGFSMMGLGYGMMPGFGMMGF